MAFAISDPRGRTSPFRYLVSVDLTDPLLARPRGFLDPRAAEQGLDRLRG